MYCIILPRAWGKMIQLTTHFEWFISSTNVTLCLNFFLSSCSQYLTVHYTFKSNKIYQVIKAGKKYFKKVDHFAPVSPIVADVLWRNDQTIPITIKYDPLSYRTGGSQKRSVQSMNADHKSLETVFSIAICRQSDDKRQSKTLFLTILDIRSSLVVLTFPIAAFLKC